MPELATPVLDRIRQPSDLRLLSSEELEQLAEEIRQFLLVAVARTGGHLGPNLGVVELTLALHRVFDSPRDRILWDTGHQAYVHKLLTRPREGFARLRKLGGMSGYPNRQESEHDFIENSHASTGLSYAAGMAEAQRGNAKAGRIVVVVGDGALTGGMAYEALNNIGHRETPMIIVLNDNGRSYAPTIGHLARQLAQHLTVLNPRYHETKAWIDRVLRLLPGGDHAMEAGRRMKEGLKELVSPSTFFEYMGLSYIGPLNGHDEAEIEGYLRQAAQLKGPVVVHVITRKGAGYGPAEEDEIDHLHGVSAFDVVTAKPLGSGKRSYTDVFAEAIVAEAEHEPRLRAITAAMGSSAGLSPFCERFRDRFYDVGIAEQHAVTFAAGLAMAGLRPVVCIYSTFLQRALDQVLMDVCLHNLPVTFVLDRAGITGDDGPSHHGIFDLTFLRAMPNLTLAAVSDAQELRDLLHTAVTREGGGPFVIRYPKGAALEPGQSPARVLPPPDWDVLRQGSSALVLATGKLVAAACDAATLLDAEGISVTVINARYVKPLDPRLETWARRHPVVVTVEDNVVTGGFGAAVAERLSPLGIPVQLLGVPSDFIPQGSQAELLHQLQLDGAGIADSIRQAVAGAALEEETQALGRPGS
jgi:1-deoxy-D-xylulose-5-phosphate synthase